MNTEEIKEVKEINKANTPMSGRVPYDCKLVIVERAMELEMSPSAYVAMVLMEHCGFLKSKKEVKKDGGEVQEPEGARRVEYVGADGKSRVRYLEGSETLENYKEFRDKGKVDHQKKIQAYYKAGEGRHQIKLTIAEQIARASGSYEKRVKEARLKEEMLAKQSKEEKEKRKSIGLDLPDVGKNGQPTKNKEYEQNTITDRINNVKGVQRSLYQDGKLVVFYDEDISKETINIRVQKELSNSSLPNPVERTNLFPKKKGNGK